MIEIPSLTTERLILRGPTAEDFEPYYAFLTSGQMTFLGGPKSRIEAWKALAALVGHWALRGFGRWIVADRRDGRYLGHVGLNYPEGFPDREIAWCVTEAAEGRGIAYEAAVAARRYAYETLGWTTAVSLVDPRNTRSAALAERLGAKLDGVFLDEEAVEARIYRHPSPAELAAAEAAA